MNKYALQNEKIKKLESLGYKLSIDEIDKFYSYIDRYNGKKIGITNAKIYTIKDKNGKEISNIKVYDYNNLFEETEKLNELLDGVLSSLNI